MEDVFGASRRVTTAVILTAFYMMAALVAAAHSVGLAAPLYDKTVAMIIIMGFTVILPMLFLLRIGGRTLYIARFVVLHVMAALVIIYIAGANNPYNVYWVLIMVMSYVTLGTKAFFVSSITFFLATLYFNLSTSELPGKSGRPALVIAGSFIALFITLCAYILIRILRRSEENRKQLETARKLEKAQFHKLDTLINSLSDTVLAVSSNGKITSQNAAALAFFDTNESLLGKNINNILPLVDSEGRVLRAADLIRDIHSTIVREDLTKVIKGEEDVRLRLQMAPISKSYGERLRPGLVVIIRDITKQKSLEEEKDEFISVASHELRTPVAIAEGSLGNLMFMQAKGADKRILQDAAVEAHKQVVYLARIINDLSTLSRAEQGVGANTEDVNSYDLLQDLFARYTPGAQEKSLQLDFDARPDLPHVITSRLYFEEILQNFLTNAIKYTQEGSVTIRAVKTETGVEFSVTDSGIGISKSDQAKIFDKFYRSEDYRTRETGGTGLGLYVVRKLAAKLDIDIVIKSRLNHGSTFSFTLPAVKKS